MPRTDAGPQPRPRVPDRTETADLRVAACLGPAVVVEICGEIDIKSAPELRDDLLRVIRRYGPRLAIDLAGVRFMDCAGLNVLLATRRRARLEQGSVRVVRASPQVLRMISLLGLEKGIRARRTTCRITSAGAHGRLREMDQRSEPGRPGQPAASPVAAGQPAGTGVPAPGAVAVTGHPEHGKRRKLLYATLPGCWGALIFACLSFAPSLLPRGGLLQGVVTGITAAIGYRLGVWAASIWRAFADRGPRRPRRPAGITSAELATFRGNIANGG